MTFNRHTGPQRQIGELAATRRSAACRVRGAPGSHEAPRLRFELAEPPNMAERDVWLTRPQYENRIANATQHGIDIALRIVAQHLKRPFAEVKRHCYERAGLAKRLGS